jgi:hypothetical protein
MRSVSSTSPSAIDATLTGHGCSRSRHEAILGSAKFRFKHVRDASVIPRVTIVQRERRNRDGTGQEGSTGLRRGFPRFVRHADPAKLGRSSPWIPADRQGVDPTSWVVHFVSPVP